MGFPEDIGVIDTMMGTTAGTTGKNRYAFLERALKDAESANMNFPAQYMFKDVAVLRSGPRCRRQPRRTAAGPRSAAAVHGSLQC